MSSYEERMEKFKERDIVNILKVYKWERPLSPELKAEIDEFYEIMGYGCWFGSWVNSKIWCWLMVEWMKNGEDLIPFHWEDIPSDDESEDEEVCYGGCPECGEPQDKPFEGMCSDCVVRKNAEFDEMEFDEMKEKFSHAYYINEWGHPIFTCDCCIIRRKTYNVGYEDADYREDEVFSSIEEARPLYDRLIATGEYGWVQILENNEEIIEEWENPNNCGACGFLVCECSEESVCDCEECNVQQ